MADDFLAEGFASISLATQQARDATLLRASTELFSQPGARDQDAIRRYAELAGHLIPKVSPIDRAFVANRLADIAEAPSTVMRLLAKDDIAIADPVLRHSPVLGALDLLVIIAATGVDHHRLIAQRDNLPAEVVKALRIAGDAIVAALLDRSRLASGESLSRGPRAGADTPAASSEDWSASRETIRLAVSRFDGSRFLKLDRTARLRLMADIATQPPTRRHLASTGSADRAFRSILGAAQVVGYARDGERALLVEAIAEGLALRRDFVDGCLDDPTGEPLAVILKALSLDGAQAAQVFLLAAPKVGLDAVAFFRLCDLYAGMEAIVAETLASAWRDADEAPPVHRPVFADIDARDRNAGLRDADRKPAERRDDERKSGTAA